MKERVLTALALIPPVLVALFLSWDWPIIGLALLVFCIGTAEIGRLVDEKLLTYAGAALLAILSFAVGAGKIGVLPADPSGRAWLVGALTLLGVLTTWLATAKGWRLFALASSAWLLGPLLALVLVHQMRPGPLWSFGTPVLLAIVPLWGGDTAAIFAGRAWGKHPLAPKISPKKTWEGAIANFLACVLVGLGLAALIGYQLPVGLLCGAAAGTFGQAGDLFESAIKRIRGVKDSGALLPGHGGIMDRIDSILFTAPLTAIVVTLAESKGTRW